MLALVYFVLFEGAGVCMAHFLLPRKAVIARVWLGLALGLGLMMWLPALCAFVCGTFGMDAQLLAMAPLMLLTAVCFFCRDKHPASGFSEDDRHLLRTLLFVSLPLTLIGAFLQWTHVLRPVDGTLHTGMTTYGDMFLHLSIAAGSRNMPFPPEYVILPGEQLNYPFLSDTLSTTFMLLGWDLRAAFMVPGIFMMALTFSGYAVLAHRMAQTKNGAVLAVLLFFLNGGLGFMYLVDMQGVSLGSPGNNELQSAVGLWERIKAVLNGWYQTPANHAEYATYNLRCSNVIVDMMLPQRTTLGGWTLLLPCMYLLYDYLRPADGLPLGVSLRMEVDGPVSVFTRRQVPVRQLLLLGVMAAMLPMVNTHCFLALGLMSAGWMLYDVIRSRKQLGKTLLGWLIYGGVAVLLAAPQLFAWTFSQAVGNETFLNFRFNWVNGELGMPDSWLWFWIKNVGLPFVLILLSLLEKNEKRRFIACGAFVIFLAAEFIQFQPNAYDNYKLFCVWYMLCAVLAADYGFELLGKLKGMRCKPVIAVLCCICFFFSGTLAVLTEMNTDWEVFSRSHVEAAEYVEKNTEEDAVFMTGTQHLNFVPSLAGRRIICGTDSWLYYHGYNTAERKADIRAFYADPAGNMHVLEKYGVDYILVSSHEYGEMDMVNRAALDAYFDRVYESEWEDVIIWKAEEERHAEPAVSVLPAA
ncbi:MAG: hypothetical protein IJO67_08320 [Clostridia bacterium]|nr:hypothetical protein [Clostridia bacterium]